MNLRKTIDSTTIGDRILLIFLLLVSFISIIFIREVLPKTRDVIVEVEGKIRYKYPIDTNRLVKIEGPYGHLSVEIKDKRVRVIDASCPNKLCERQGWITRGIIICLPNRITVIVGSPDGAEDRAVDAITG